MLNAVTLSLQFENLSSAKKAEPLPLRKCRSSDELFESCHQTDILESLLDPPIFWQADFAEGHTVSNSTPDNHVLGPESDADDMAQPHGRSTGMPDVAVESKDEHVDGLFDGALRTLTKLSKDVSSIIKSLDWGTSAQQPFSTEHHHFEYLLTLVDAALRNLICQKPIRIAAGIQSDIDADHPRLVDICPSLFSPGYSNAISERVRLLPVIARSLSLVANGDDAAHHTQNLQAIVAKSCLATTLVDSVAGNTTIISLNDYNRAIQCRLWTTMAQGLRDPEPARRLKPLKAFDSEPTELLVQSCDLPIHPVAVQRDSHFQGDDGLDDADNLFDNIPNTGYDSDPQSNANEIYDDLDLYSSVSHGRTTKCSTPSPRRTSTTALGTKLLNQRTI